MNADRIASGYPVLPPHVELQLAGMPAAAAEAPPPLGAAPLPGPAVHPPPHVARLDADPAPHGIPVAAQAVVAQPAPEAAPREPSVGEY